MKRLLLIAVMGGAALVPVAAQAQRGGMGGHGGMGARGGGASHVSAARPAGRVGVAGAVRATSMRAHTLVPGQRAFSSRNRFDFDRRRRFDFDRFGRFRRNRFFNDCFNSFGVGFGCNSPFLYGGYPYYDPFFDNSGYQQPQQEPVTVENGGNDRETAFEIQALHDEIQAMRDEERARFLAEHAPPAKPSAHDDDGNATLVFRDGRQLSVRNYAIADHTIWVLNASSSRKIPVSDLDVQATEQANAKNGVEFRLPN